MYCIMLSTIAIPTVLSDISVWFLYISVLVRDSQDITLATRITPDQEWQNTEEYDNIREDWLAYTERMEQYFAENNVKSSVQQLACEEARGEYCSVCGRAIIYTTTVRILQLRGFTQRDAERSPGQVCWVNDERIQRRLPAEADLSFKRAYDVAH